MGELKISSEIDGPVGKQSDYTGGVQCVALPDR